MHTKKYKGKMDIENYFKNIERNLNIRFSHSFFIFSKKFLSMTKMEEFSSFFNKFHFASENEIKIFFEENIADEYIPFFIDEQEKIIDYYCFLRNEIKHKKEIIIFSQDNVVFDWDTAGDFIEWIERKI